MRFKRVCVLGVGLLGGSIGLAIKRRAKQVIVAGYAHRSETLRRAGDLGAIDEAYDEPTRAVQDADLVVLCTPVGLLGDLLDQLAPGLASGAIVTDVGSVKRAIVARAPAALAGRDARFVGSHPMAGSEKKGVEHARADLFEGALCILTPDGSTDAEAVRAVESFWGWLGMRTARMTPEEHDRRVAAISHLPHALAAALVAMQEPAALELAANGFADLTRIAEGDGGLWRDILLENRDHLRSALGQLNASLNELLALLDPPDPDRLRDWLDAAAGKRQAWDALRPGRDKPR